MPATKPKPNFATAFFHASYGTATIDKEAGILRGVKIMDVGHVAQFKADDGESKRVTISPAHIAALLSHAGNRALPIHETHEWFDAEGEANADSVERSARIGSLKSFRTDAAGNLIADAYLNLDKQPARDLLFGAEHNPEDNCFSAVFSYRKDDPQCMPINFRAGDIVPAGAATTALFKNTETKNALMALDLNELIAALDDPKIKTAIKAITKSHEDASSDTPEDKAEGAAMEKDADVKPEDKKPEDDQKPALMSARLRVSRAIRRQAAELKADRTAILADAKRDAEALQTAMLGKNGGFKPSGEPSEENSPEAFITARLADGKAKNRGQAIVLMARQKPDLYQAHTTR